jgi:long-chain acyl-CoA synthetase
MMRLAKENKLNSLEKPKQIKFVQEPWTVENDYLTPTMKMKRNIAKIKLADEITALYASPIMKEEK